MIHWTSGPILPPGSGQPTPADYVRALENESAERLLSEIQGPVTEWKIQDGFVHLVKVDEGALRRLLAGKGHGPREIDDFVRLYTDPGFNQRNRRGIERLRIRIKHCSEIGQKLLGGGIPSITDIPVGVVMRTYLNAGALPVPGRGDAIVINLGLVYLYDFFNLASHLERESPGPPNSQQVAQLTGLASAIFGNEAKYQEFVTAFPRSLATDADTKLWSRVKMAMCTLFILLHEYAHIVLGHTTQVRAWPDIRFLPEAERHSYCRVLRGWEYDADRYAYDVLCGKLAAPGVPTPAPKLAEMAITETFTIMGLAQGLNHALENEGDSHPPPRKRLFHLLNVSSPEEFWQRRRQPLPDSAPDNQFFEVMLRPLLEETGAIQPPP